MRNIFKISLLVIWSFTALAPSMVAAQTTIQTSFGSSNSNTYTNGVSNVQLNMSNPNSNQSTVSNPSSGISACSTIASYGFKGLVDCATALMGSAVLLIVSLSVLTVMWGAFTMLSSEGKRESGRQIVIYGIIGLFVMVSIWGFVNILDSTFRLSGQEPLPVPKFTQQP